MSLAAALRDELQVWRTAWQQVDTFIDRVNGARDDDQSPAEKMRALLELAAAIEAEARLRTGSGFLPPLELAEAAGLSVRSELTQSTAATEPDLPAVDPAMKRRLPGAYDVEIAVAAINSLPPTTKFDRVSLLASLTLFDLFDEQSHTWQPFRVPDYDFGDWTTGDSQRLIDPDTGLFPLGKRTELAVQGHGELTRWQALRNARLGSRRPEDRRVDAARIDAVLAGGASAGDREMLRSAARDAAAACRQGLATVAASGSALEGTALAAHLDAIRNDLQGRAADYDSVDRLVGASPLDPSQLLAVRGRIAGRGAIGGGVNLALDGALDEAVDARIAYPDGTLRILRTMEWSFRLHWPFRKAWFDVRHPRRLQPVLDGFLKGFTDSLRAALHAQSTPLTFEATLHQPSATGAESLTLAAPRPGGDDALDLMVPGTFALLDGARRTLALCLRAEPGSAAEPRRLRIVRLFVSLAGGPLSPGVAGMVDAGAPVTGRAAAEATPQALLHGEVPGHPEHDGVPVAIVALWSRLCLILGTTAVTAKLANANGQPAPAMSALSLAARLPVLAPVEPSATRLVLDAGAVQSMFDVNRPDGPPFARQGELLLLRGTDPAGVVRQIVVEVISIARTDPENVDEEIAAAPLARPICCRGPGERLVIQVNMRPLDVPLIGAVTLHRDFRGFGARTLAAAEPLPDAVDSSAATTGEGRDIDRSRELDLAVRTLKEWTS